VWRRNSRNRWRGPTPSRAASSATEPDPVSRFDRFARDSPLEQAGFELPVPPARAHGAAGGRRRRRRWGMSRLLLSLMDRSPVGCREHRCALLGLVRLVTMTATPGQSSPGCAYNLGNFMRKLAMLSSTSLSRWDRQFESGLLQRRVMSEPGRADARCTWRPCSQLQETNVHIVWISWGILPRRKVQALEPTEAARCTEKRAPTLQQLCMSP
jgi:hypothetical protein